MTVTPRTIARTPPARAQAAMLGAAVPTLRTERLVLRAPRLEDFDLYSNITCGSRGRHVGGPFSVAQAWDDFCRMTATWLLRGHGAWTATRTATANGNHVDTPLGVVLIGCEPGDEAPELGALFAEAAEGHGYATEAARAALAFARDTLHLPCVVSYCHAQNTRAHAMMRRLGAGAPQHRATTSGGQSFWRFVHWGTPQ